MTYAPDFAVVVDKLIAARREQGMTQLALAKVLGCAQPTVSDLETGQSHSLRLLHAYANALGYDVHLELELIARDPRA